MQRGSVLLALVVVVMMAMGRTATAQTTYSQVLQQIFEPTALAVIALHGLVLRGMVRLSVSISTLSQMPHPTTTKSELMYGSRREPCRPAAH